MLPQTHLPAVIKASIKKKTKLQHKQQHICSKCLLITCLR
jgi:hypothetical protein